MDNSEDLMDTSRAMSGEEDVSMSTPGSEKQAVFEKRPGVRGNEHGEDIKGVDISEEVEDIKGVDTSEEVEDMEGVDISEEVEDIMAMDTSEESRVQNLKRTESAGVVEDQVVVYGIPQYLLYDIFNRLEDARFIALAQLLCKDWADAGNNVRSLRFIVLDVYHVSARDPNKSGKSFGSDDEAGPSSASGPGVKRGKGRAMSLKETFVEYIVGKKRGIVQLRIEVETKLQSKTVPESERRRTDFWLTDPYFLNQWLPGMGTTLQHLCIVDYGQQAIMRRSSIIKILSENCKVMKTLELRNMFIDTSDCDYMGSMVSLTLRCVKVVGEALKHINETMPKLQTLALLGVFGAEGGVLEFLEMKVLCLGLSTPAKDVVMNLPMLEKLQLKMQCPEKLIIDAPALKYVAFNLEVLEPSKVELKSMVRLEELLYGATSFATLIDLVEKNVQHLMKLFLDIPCMALGEDGRFLGVIEEISLQLPSFSKLYMCVKLSVLNIGPGLWHSMETQVTTLVQEERWPSVKTLILHMIPFEMDSALTVLRLLLRPTVTSLTVFIHSSSPVSEELLIPRIQAIAQRQNITPNISSWTKSLDFSCFSF